MISGRKMICLVISQCLSVSCKLMSVVSCRHGSPGNLEKEVYHFLDFSGELYVCVLFVKVLMECVDSSCRTVVNVLST